MTDTIIKTKVSGRFTVMVIERTFSNGRVTWGQGTSAGVRFGYSKKQAMSLFRKHDACQHNPDVLLYN